MKLALLTTDNRQEYHQYDKTAPWFGTAPEALLQGFDLLKQEIEVHVVSCTQRPMESPEKLSDNIWFHSLHVPKIGWLRTGYQGCIRAFRAKIKEIQPDLVHGQGTERDCALGAIFSGCPNVVTIHGNMAELSRHLKAFPGTALWLAGQLENLTLPATRGVLCNSAYTESLVSPRNRHTWRVPNPLRLPFFEPIPGHPPGDRPHLVNVGVISPRKRQVEILELFKRLFSCGVACRIEFIGAAPVDDPYARKFLKAMEEATMEGYAVYSGLKETGSLIATFDLADGCIHFPSEEAFGLIVAESLARNLKFFGSDLGGITDIARSVDGAELFATDDWTALEETLLQWIQKGCTRPEKAHREMATRYHPRIIAERHLEIYREVLSRP